MFTGKNRILLIFVLSFWFFLAQFSLKLQSQSKFLGHLTVFSLLIVGVQDLVTKVNGNKKHCEGEKTGQKGKKNCFWFESVSFWNFLMC